MKGPQCARSSTPRLLTPITEHPRAGRAGRSRSFLALFAEAAPIPTITCAFPEYSIVCKSFMEFSRHRDDQEPPFGRASSPRRGVEVEAAHCLDEPGTSKRGGVRSGDAGIERSDAIPRRLLVGPGPWNGGKGACRDVYDRQSQAKLTSKKHAERAVAPTIPSPPSCRQTALRHIHTVQYCIHTLVHRSLQGKLARRMACDHPHRVRGGGAFGCAHAWDRSMLFQRPSTPREARSCFHAVTPHRAPRAGPSLLTPRKGGQSRNQKSHHVSLDAKFYPASSIQRLASSIQHRHLVYSTTVQYLAAPTVRSTRTNPYED
jgi:hypothetical protein